MNIPHCNILYFVFCTFLPYSMERLCVKLLCTAFTRQYLLDRNLSDRTFDLIRKICRIDLIVVSSCCGVLSMHSCEGDYLNPKSGRSKKIFERRSRYHEQGGAFPCAWFSVVFGIHICTLSLRSTLFLVFPRATVTLFSRSILQLLYFLITSLYSFNFRTPKHNTPRVAMKSHSSETVFFWLNNGNSEKRLLPPVVLLPTATLRLTTPIFLLSTAHSETSKSRFERPAVLRCRNNK